MLWGKIFGAKKSEPPLSFRAPAAAVALKIIHAGGGVELYYMATPAARIMEKYSGFVLARPEVFRRPWESRVKPDEILFPGQKYYVIPKQTFIKLRRRTKRSCNASFVSQSSNYASSNTESSLKTSRSKGKIRKGGNRRVRFIGVNGNKDEDSDSCSASSECVKDGGAARNGKRRAAARQSATWQPSLTVISETFGHNE